MPESGHVVYIERPDIFFPALKVFMAAKTRRLRDAVQRGDGVNNNVATLSHMTDGAGDPLVLLNGIAMTAVSWEVWRDRLHSTIG